VPSQPVSPPSPGRALAHDPYGEFVRRAQSDGVMYDGRHNRNFVLPLTEPMARLVRRAAGTPAIVRVRALSTAMWRASRCPASTATAHPSPAP
jgi:hypothetical protein